MKVIINVKKKNQYSKYNGLTFEVKDVMSFGVGVLGISVNSQVDFSWSEVIVVELVDTVREFYKNDVKKLSYLFEYIRIKGITLHTNQYAIYYTISVEDLKCLFIHTRDAYKDYTYESWVTLTQKNYSLWFNVEEGRTKPFSQWVNDQIIALT